MRDKLSSQPNTVPETPNIDATATHEIKSPEVGSAKEHYKQFVDYETVPDTETIVSVKTDKDNTPQRVLSALIVQAQHILESIPVAVVAIIVGMITFIIHSYRIDVAPDIFGDEATYLLIGTNLAKGLGLIVSKGDRIFFWHPPAYFLVEAAYIKLLGLTNTDLLTALLSVRYINVFFSACTAALLLLFGRKLHSYKAGIIMAALFIMDPYVQRINRRNMLETLAMLCALLGLYIFFTHRPHLTVKQRLGSGIAFSLAVLTKEPLFLELFVLIIYALWFKRSQLRDIIYITAIACTSYLIYPIWAFEVGQGNTFLAYKLYGIKRIISYLLNQPSPLPPDGSRILPIVKSISWVSNLHNVLIQYATSYLLIALAAGFTIVLIFRFRQIVAARYLICIWSIFSFGFGLGVGKVDDQFFYYLIVPSIVITGYFLATLLEIVLYPSSQEKRPAFSRTYFESRIMLRLLSVIFVIIFLFNSYIWTTKYAIGTDDAYINIIRFVRTHIPKGESILVSDDATYWFLSSQYHILFYRDLNTTSDIQPRYFILSSKDVVGGYDGTTAQLYNWVLKSSHRIFEQNDLSFGTVGIYLQRPISAPTVPSPSSSITIQKSYLGTLYDIPTGLKTTILLTNIRQQGWNIRGYLSETSSTPFLNNKLKNSSFVGTLNSARQVTFSVINNNTKQPILSFQGEILPNGSISGTYCSIETKTRTCSDYGLWSFDVTK